ncbi:MAG: pseudaminic acid synthase [Pseudomonadota bacterium]
MTPIVEIAGRPISANHPPYVICELSANHNGSLDRALMLIDEAAKTGADAIKIQTYTADSLTIDHDGPGFSIDEGLWAGRTLYDLYGEAQTPFEWHEAMFARAKENNVVLFSTPFDYPAVDLLDEIGAPAFKVASLEATDLPLIAYIASKRKPMIISTGTCNLGEIEEAYRTAKENGCDDVILLHCVSSYPAATEDSNVRVVPHLRDTFGCVSGLSDHTFSSAAAVASIALGGCVIEKHFTTARADGGPDSEFSLEPDEFQSLVEDCKGAWMSLGEVTYEIGASEAVAAAFRRSLYVVADIALGEAFTHNNVRSIRPGYGLTPKLLPEVVGKKARRALKRGEPLDWSMID